MVGYNDFQIKDLYAATGVRAKISAVIGLVKKLKPAVSFLRFLAKFRLKGPLVSFATVRYG